jgi:uncharacterized membrane protein YoaK (UPF0700 family)
MWRRETTMMMPSVTAIDPHAGAPVPSVDSTLVTRLIPGLLSVIAGSTDVISFLGLAGLFTAHITGNLVVLAAHITTGQPASIAAMLSVPVFMAVLGVSKALAAALDWIGAATLQPFLLIQFLLLAGFLFARLAGGAELDPNAALAIFAGMLGVAAMAVQNTLVQISLKGAPSTAVMTTNITRFMMDVGEVLLGRDAEGTVEARRRAKHTWPAIVGFAAGCALGAACEASFGSWSLTVPTGLALLAFAMAVADTRPGPQRPT